MFVFLPGKTGATVHLLFKMWLFSDILCLLWLVTWFFLKIIQISEYTELCMLSSNFLFHRIKRIFSLSTKRKQISKSLHLTKPEPEKKLLFDYQNSCLYTFDWLPYKTRYLNIDLIFSKYTEKRLLVSSNYYLIWLERKDILFTIV